MYVASSDHACWNLCWKCDPEDVFFMIVIMMIIRACFEFLGLFVCMGLDGCVHACVHCVA